MFASNFSSQTLHKSLSFFCSHSELRTSGTEVKQRGV